MTFQIENETEIRFNFDTEKLIEKVVTAALDYENCPYECEVNVLLTDNAGIHEVNKAMRGIDRETDVLSFPIAEYEHPADFDRLDDQPDVFNPETGEYMLGDIMISVDRVKEQAKEYNHSEKRELAFLVAHSMLHLMGYDHMDDTERAEMEDRQDRILRSINLGRDCKDEESL